VIRARLLEYKALMSGFYTTTYMLHRHTGGGVGEIWRSAATGLLQDRKPAQYRDLFGATLFKDIDLRSDGSTASSSFL